MRTRILLAILLMAHAAWAQIVVKHTGQMADIALGVGRTQWTDIDVDGDGVDEVNAGRVHGADSGWGLLNVITGQLYRLAPEPSYIDLETGTTFAGISKCRSVQQAEFSYIQGNTLTVKDIATGEILFHSASETAWQRIIVRDFDGDGLDDVFALAGPQAGPTPACYKLTLLGTGAAALASPGNSLVITRQGPDALLTWAGVGQATGYRVLWSASLEAPCYTQVGYTTEPAFLHPGFGDVETGFYKVIAVSAGSHGGRVAGEGHW